MMNDGHKDNSVGERKLIWDEENRLLSVDDNGFVSNYWYDADGERTVKTSGESDQVYVNGVFSGGSTNTAKFSLYVSPYLVANQGGRYTKHIYAGSQRIVSKVGDFASYGSDPRRIEYAGSETDGLSVDYKSKYTAQQQVIKDHYTFFDVPYNGTDNNNYADGEGFCCNDGTLEAAQAKAMRKAQSRAVAKSFKDPDNYENLQFFYHPDHLGSSSFITNLDGEVVQHIEYVPFGEVFIEERNNIWNTPYLFNAKEFDEETGLYYYGARYYDPRLSLWMSTDPMQEKYPSHTSYNYTYNNPIKYIDLWGCEGEIGDNHIPNQLRDYISDEQTITALNNAVDEMMKSGIGKDKIAIGVERSVTFDTTSGAKVSVAGTQGVVMFLGGEDAYYLYPYISGEIDGGLEFSVGVHLGQAKNYFIAYQNAESSTNHRAFEGRYIHGGVNLGLDVPLVGASIGLDIAQGVHTKESQPYWTVVSLTSEIQVGIGVPSFVDFGISGGFGTTKFLNPQSVGQPKSKLQKVGSILNLFPILF